MPSIKRGNSSNCVHWLYATRRGTLTSIAFSKLAMDTSFVTSRHGPGQGPWYDGAGRHAEAGLRRLCSDATGGRGAVSGQPTPAPPHAWAVPGASVTQADDGTARLA